jgi:CYTH domain-containing protein
MTHNTTYKVAITGGPCGGKTTAMAKITERFTDLGFNVLVVPELATINIKGGLKPWEMSPQRLKVFQTEIIRSQLQLEDSFIRNAESFENNKPTMILTDRGALDGKAYMSESLWREIMTENGWNETILGDSRYAGVLHMVTAADGAERFYTLENNQARTETPEQARELDLKTQKAWVGHPHLRVIGNQGTFKDKILSALKSISRIVGVPEPLEVERKFELKKVPDMSSFPVHYEQVNIEQTYLITNDKSVESERVRKRYRDDGSVLYYHTVKKNAVRGQRIEEERLIDENEYFKLIEEKRDFDRETIVKTRYTFLYEKRYFELDIFEGKNKGIAMLEIELDDENEEVMLPPFLSIQKEVTGDKAFTNYALSEVVKLGKRSKNDTRGGILPS